MAGPTTLYTKAGTTMARFASRFGQYRHGIRNGRWMVLADGQNQELVRELFAVFQSGPTVLQEDEILLAMKNMVHKGLPIDRDTEEHFSPRSRISGFDSVLAQGENDWTDQERELVELKLRESTHFGIDHIELIPEPATKPWPTFDSDSIETIVTVATTTNQVEQVLAYEAENQNRPELVEALTEVPETEKAVVLDAS